MDTSVGQLGLINQLLATNPEDTVLCEKWMEICHDLDIDLQNIRRNVDPWFQECYLTSMNISGCSRTKKMELYEKFFEELDEVIQRENEILIKCARHRIKRNYDACPNEWIDAAVECVHKERKLIEEHSERKLEFEEAEAMLKVEQNIKMATEKQKNICDCLSSLENKVSALGCHSERFDEKQEHFKNFKIVKSNPQLKVQPIPVGEEFFEKVLEEIDSDISDTVAQVVSLYQEVEAMVQTIYDILVILVSDLKVKVKEWQKKFQLKYAKLAKSPDLEKLAQWCAPTGRIIQILLNENLDKWYNILVNIPVCVYPCIETDQNIILHYVMQVTILMEDFVQSTFLVTKQGSFFVKTGNKKFPAFNVRLLAADNIHDISGDVVAHFVFEDDLKLCCNGDQLDLEKLKSMEKCKMKTTEKCLKNNLLKLKSTKGHNKMECCFQNLQFKEKPFKRLTTKEVKPVHEEKYRVVFVTTIMSKLCWTMSLPLVVTTASNQEAHSLASIMWQCYSTDVFSLEYEIPQKLPWSTVASMLKMKLSKLSKAHTLTGENITHLKNRLFGVDNQTDDAQLTLAQFCLLPMVDVNFSFWKWFLGIYNLLKESLKPFWADGLIMGFVKKEDAVQMLEKCTKPGTFILRFSDKHIVKSDGLTSIYGHLTAGVLLLKEEKGGRRNSLGQPVKVKVIEHYDVADFKKLRGNNLANILKESSIKARDGTCGQPMYKHLYPGNTKREDLFDTYCNEGSNPISGYTRPKEAYVAYLEQALAKMHCDEQVASPRISMDADINFQSASAKKCRRSTELHGERTNGSPRGNNSSQSNISSPQGSPFTVQNPMTHSQKSYDGQSPGTTLMSPAAWPVQSPMQSVPSPTISIQLPWQQSPDCMVPVSANMSLLPTVIESDGMDPTSLPGDISSCSLVDTTCNAEQGGHFVDELFDPESTMLGSAEWLVGVADMSQQVGQNTPSGVVADIIDQTMIQNTGNDAVTEISFDDISGINSIEDTDVVPVSSDNSGEVLGFNGHEIATITANGSAGIDPEFLSSVDTMDGNA